MSVLVDTSVLIDHLRGRVEARDLLHALVGGGEVVYGSALTRTEILAGVRHGEEGATEALLGVVEWVPVGVEIADRAGVLAQRYLASHGAIDTVDYVIAATVESLAAELLTRNVKHFPMIAGLRAPY